MGIKKTWISKEAQVDNDFIDLCCGDRVLAVLLKNRGIDTKEKIDAFLNPLKASFIHPDVFSDMDKTVQRIKKAVDAKENITVYGDFDADGVTSTAILYLTLKKIGACVDYYLPDRAAESHGLNTKALINIISKKKSKLIITVDCGISNIQEVKFANGFKADIIITDHHEAADILPEAFSILNPKAPDSLKSNLSIQELQSLNLLAGVGVTFKLCCKLLEMYAFEDFVHELIPLVAIGTVGDVVPLVAENRSLVAIGLELIKKGRHKGVQKIIDSIGVTDKNNLTSENIAFGIVPRINATGRLDSPVNALKVLISDDDEEIDNCVKLLNDFNTMRQQLCDETFLKAREMYEKNKVLYKKSIMLLHSDWHVGIIGIVASRLVEEYNRPVFLMTRDNTSPNIIRCSCRSIVGVNIFDVLSQHKDIFVGFGGHKMAAGFSFDENKIKFDDFKNLIDRTIDELAVDVDFSSVNVFADMVVEPDEITEKTIENINKLQPFGAGNASPVFIMNNLLLKDFKMMGQSSNHLKIIAKKNDKLIECVKWNVSCFNLPKDVCFDILFSAQINEFNLERKIQYLLSDIHCDTYCSDVVGLDIKILDHRNKNNILNQVLDFIDSTRKNTCIYVENPQLKKMIEHNEMAVKISFERHNIPSDKEQIMFFESPVNKDDFIRIIKTTGADFVHLMNFVISDITVDNLITTLSGMLKYSFNNLAGKIQVDKLSKTLGVDCETIINAMTMFDEVQMIKLCQISENEYRITSLNPVGFSKIKQSSVYSIIEDQIKEINDFKQFYKNATIEEIKSILN